MFILIICVIFLFCPQGETGTSSSIMLKGQKGEPGIEGPGGLPGTYGAKGNSGPLGKNGYFKSLVIQMWLIVVDFTESLTVYSSSSFLIILI